MKQMPLNQSKLYINFRELVEDIAFSYGEKIAYSFRISPKDEEVQQISYAQLAEDVRCLSTALISKGVHKGHTALIGKLSYEWALTYFAALSIGAVLVPLDREWTGADLTDTVRRADCELLFFDEDIEDKAKEVAEGVGIASAPVSLSQASFEALLARGRELFEANTRAYFDTRITPNALSLLVFTSGTTGKGKGA